MARLKELKPVVETDKDWDQLEVIIKKIFRDLIYKPLVKELEPKTRRKLNASDALIEAIRSGRITHRNGRFFGKLNSSISKELEALGAYWDKSEGVFRLEKAGLPVELRAAIDTSVANFEAMVARMDAALVAAIPKATPDQTKIERFFDTTLYRTDGKLQKTLESVAIVPRLDKEARLRISEEYTRNLDLYIQDFKQEEITKLRTMIEKAVLTGDRQKALEQMILDSFDVSQNKAKFLARQESNLLVTKYKQVRYQDAGVDKYRWHCVSGSALHPVRPMHKKNDGKIYTWDNPPTVNEAGDRKNPGQDYNCRCQAIPVVEF